MKRPTEWLGDNPYYLFFAQPVPVVEDGRTVGEEFNTEFVDLDRFHWMDDQGWIFRAEGELHLVRKEDNGVVLSVHADPGDQTYYVARHIGIAAGGGTATQVEVVAFGIGKKRASGNQDNLWVLPWGQICGGNDVEHFALKGLKQGLLPE